MRAHLRELERAFGAFERGDVNRLYESRESLLGLSEAIESDGWYTLTPICEIASKLLGVVLMERGLSEVRAVQVVRELLQYVEGEIARANESQGAVDPGGVFHIVNSQKVGELLVKKGLVSSEDLEKALVLQGVRRGRRVGEVLVAMNVIDQRTLDEVLQVQKAETRREETRRSSRPNSPESGGPSLSITAGSNTIPPVPTADDSAPTLTLGSDGQGADLPSERDSSFDGPGGSLEL